MKRDSELDEETRATHSLSPSRAWGSVKTPGVKPTRKCFAGLGVRGTAIGQFKAKAVKCTITTLK